MEPIKVNFGSKNGEKEKVAVPSKSWLRILINVLVTIVGAAIAFYVMIPAINLKDKDFYIYLIVVLLIYCVSAFITSMAIRKPEYVPYAKRQSIVPIIIGLVIVAVMLVGMLVSSVVFRAKDYAQIIDVQQGNFSEDIAQTDFSNVPVIDTDAVAALGDRQMGSLDEEGLVSQFNVYKEGYNQINYQGRPVFVTTMQYADIIRWLTNQSEGLPGYILVDGISQQAKVVMMEDGQRIKYSQSEHFNRLLERHLRFQYPTYLFDTPSFEIDENGHPYWISARLDKTIGLFGGTDVIGVVITDAVTGESNEYSMDEVRNGTGNDGFTLSWIDRVYSPMLLNEQYNYYGKYQNGFFNTLFGKRDMRVTTENNGFLALNDDVYMYTGVTSITSDQSIIGFVLINERTKEATFYPQVGAKESSAQQSAQGAVQQYSYAATFPLLLNVGGQPTYFMSLKDASSLVKMYALVNVEQYSTVTATGNTIEEVTANYLDMCRKNGIEIAETTISDDIGPDSGTAGEAGGEPQQPTTKEVTGVIEQIKTVVTGGNTYYYIKFTGSDVYYSVSVADHEQAVTFDVGDSVTLTVPVEDAAIMAASDAALAS